MMIKLAKWVVVASIWLLVLSGCHNKNACQLPPLNTVSDMQIANFMGQWYQIAAIPNFYHENYRCMQYHYSLTNHAVSMITTYKRGHELITENASAYPIWQAGYTKMKMRFYWPFNADWWVLYHDANYQTAIVGVPSRKFVWILARKPVISQKLYQALVEKTRALGFDVSRLVVTSQSCHGILH